MAYTEHQWKKWMSTNNIQLQMLFAMILLKGLGYNKMTSTPGETIWKTMSQKKEIIGTIVTVNISPLSNGKAKMS